MLKLIFGFKIKILSLLNLIFFYETLRNSHEVHGTFRTVGFAADVQTVAFDYFPATARTSEANLLVQKILLKVEISSPVVNLIKLQL